MAWHGGVEVGGCVGGLGGDVVPVREAGGIVGGGLEDRGMGHWWGSGRGGEPGGIEAVPQCV